jgi:hypothetical protein
MTPNTPKTSKPLTPNTKQLTFNIPSSSSTNATPMKSHITPSKNTPNPTKYTPSENTPGRNTPSKNGIKNVMFLSPMKSSKKKESVDGEGGERKGSHFYMYIYIYLYLYTYINVYVFIYICIYIYICMYEYICICLYIFVYIYPYTYLHTYMGIYICIYIYIYIHTNMYREERYAIFNLCDDHEKR